MAMVTANVATAPPIATAVPVPMPVVMARSTVDIEVLGSEVWPLLVGKWKTQAPVAIPSMPCCTASAEFDLSPLTNGVYPFTQTTTVKWCGCCQVMKDHSSGQVSGDGTTISATDSSGYQSGGTVVDMDAKSKKVTYQLTGASAQGSISGTSVVTPEMWTDTVHTELIGTMVLVYYKQ